jgi:uncharacterized HAD superfamily protein
MRIGFDIDGVLADFNSSFIELVKEVTGRNLFPDGYWPHTWDYPEALGYSKDETSAVWERIKAGGTFWNQLAPLPDMAVLQQWMILPFGESAQEPYHEFYFITSRMGKNVKLQTEEWLDEQMQCSGHTVLISSEKGALCKALKLDYYIDDRAENILDVMQTSPSTFAYLLDQPWNQHVAGPNRVPSIADFLEILDAHSLAAA